MLSSSQQLQRGKSRHQYLYRQISERIRRKIEDGELAPLARLPSMDELAKQLKVNKITVRKALGELRADGLIYSVPAQGTFVADPLGPQLGLRPAAVALLLGRGEEVAAGGGVEGREVEALPRVRPLRDAASVCRCRCGETRESRPVHVRTR
jgi:DNA-binding transcriptional MocR family regulator